MSALEPGLYTDGDHQGILDADGDFSYVNSDGYHCTWRTTDLRPLIVLDLEDDSPASYILDLRFAASHSNGDGRRLDQIADQIEAQTKRARIPEPGLWGVVEASYSESPRCHYTLGPDGLWHSLRPPFTGIVVVAWDLLLDPTLIREGVTS